MPTRRTRAGKLSQHALRSRHSHTTNNRLQAYQEMRENTKGLEKMSFIYWKETILRQYVYFYPLYTFTYNREINGSVWVVGVI